MTAEYVQLAEAFNFAMQANLWCGFLFGALTGMHLPGLFHFVRYRAYPRIRRYVKARRRDIHQNAVKSR